MKEHDYILTLGRYVGIEDDDIPFEDKVKVFISGQFKESKELEERIRKIYLN